MRVWGPADHSTREARIGVQGRGTRKPSGTQSCWNEQRALISEELLTWNLSRAPAPAHLIDWRSKLLSLLYREGNWDEDGNCILPRVMELSDCETGGLLQTQKSVLGIIPFRWHSTKGKTNSQWQKAHRNACWQGVGVGVDYKRSWGNSLDRNVYTGLWWPFGICVFVKTHWTIQIKWEPLLYINKGVFF